jgi:hypothetical protein
VTAKLDRLGLIVRREPLLGGTQCLFSRASDREESAVPVAWPRVTPSEKVVLDRLARGQFHRLADLGPDVGSAPHVAQRVARLLAKGLIEAESDRWGKRIRLIARGATHPAYDADARKAPSFDPARLLRPHLQTIVKAIAALGEPSALALSLSTGISPSAGYRTRSMSHFLLQLRGAGLVEQIKGGRYYPSYRLTDRGTAIAKVLASEGDAGHASIVGRDHGLEVAKRRAASNSSAGARPGKSARPATEESGALA